MLFEFTVNEFINVYNFSLHYKHVYAPLVMRKEMLKNWFMLMYACYDVVLTFP